MVKEANDIVVKVEDLVHVGDTDDETNIRATMVGKYLVLVIDTTLDQGPSSTGKMLTVASSRMFKSLPGKLKGNIYVGRKITNYSA